MSADWSVPKRMPQLDGLRGLACLFVLIHHYFTGIYHPPEKSAAWAVNLVVRPFLESGVDLFFVLSGFLIGGILLDHKGSPNFFSTFYIRRICRIWPVNYFLLATFILVLLAGIPDRISGSEWLLGKPMPLWSYATFTQNIPMGLRDTVGAHWMGITWSLAVEEQFYLLIPLVVYWLPRRYLGLFTGAILPIALLLRIGATGEYGFYAGYVWLPCRMDALMMGVIVAQLLRNDTAIAFFRQHRRAVYSVFLALALLLQFDAVHKVLIFPSQSFAIALAYAMLILIIVLHEDSLLTRMLKSKFLIFTGLISYALYMYHQAINGILHMLVFHDEPRMNGWARFAVTSISVVIAFLISYASQLILERPIRNWGRQFKYLPKPPPTAHPDDPGPTTEPPPGDDEDETDNTPVLR